VGRTDPNEQHSVQLNDSSLTPTLSPWRGSHTSRTETTSPQVIVPSAPQIPPRGDACKLLPTETVGMTYKYNPFAAAYPSDRGPLGKILQPVIDLNTYVRAGHLLLMFPLGIAYFVLLVVTFSVGGSLIWTLVGPVILIAVLFVSRWLGDLEAMMAGYANRTDIRRPPSKLEGVTNFRSQVKVRLVDPTTWTGLIYLFAQFPLGIAAFVGMVVMYSFVGALIFAPVIGLYNNESFNISSDPGWPFAWDYALSSPVSGIPLTIIGLLGLVLVSHVILAFSSLHGWWAKVMLGSRSTRISSRQTPTPDGDDPPKPSTTAEPLSSDSSAVAVDERERASESDLSANESVQPETNDEPELESPNTAAHTSLSPDVEAPSEPFLKPVPNPSELQVVVEAVELVIDLKPIAELTTREQEVFMLMAHGDTNADIAEELFISEGTVKTHVKRVLSKLYMRDRTQVVVFAYEKGLVVPGGDTTLQATDAQRSYGG
jgi:DNA-binding CsgD family transcriptional regulator